jgi:hypothetical protein
MKNGFYKHERGDVVGCYVGARPDIGMSLERMQNYIAEQLRERQIELEKAKAELREILKKAA